VLFDGCGANLDAVFQYLDRNFSRGPRRLSLGKVRAMVVRDGVDMVTARLCRSCRPSLPELDPSDAVLRPACWDWPSDLIVLDLRAKASLSPSPNAPVLPHQRAAFAMLKLWQDGRCAICGTTPTHGRLYRDHNHVDELIRGLCSPATPPRAAPTSPLYANYRQRHPSAILAVEVLYLPATYRPVQ
jgi:hypothetical protein